MEQKIYVSKALGEFIRNLQKSQTPQQFQKLVTAIQNQLYHVHQSAQKIPVGKERAKEANKLMQKVINEQAPMFPAYEQISCKAGCSACCHQQIDITESEAILLASLIENGVKIDFKKLEEQAAFNGDEDDWWRLPKEKNACIFLDENKNCKVYENRPLACRKYFVVSPPEVCGQVSMTGRVSVKVFAIPDAEVIYSALGSTKDLPIPKALSKKLKDRRKN